MKRLFYVRSIILSAILFTLSSCAFGPLYNWRPSDHEEELRFVENNIGLKLIWKKDIGTLRPYRENTGYIIGGSPVVLKDRIYFLEWPNSEGQPHLYELDARKGDFVAKFQMPKNLPCLECIIEESDGNLLIPIRYDSRFFSFVRINLKMQITTLLPDNYWAQSWGYRSGKIIDLNPFNNSVGYKDPLSGKPIWKANPFPDSYHPSDNNSVMVLDLDRAFVYSEKVAAALSPDRAWELAAIDLNDGRVLWHREFPDGGNAFYKRVDASGRRISDLWREMRVDKNLYIFRGAYLIETKVPEGKLMAFNGETGEILWEKPGVVPTYAMTEGWRSNLFYIKKYREPWIYQLAPETGEVQKLISLISKVPIAPFLVSEEGIVIYLKSNEETEGEPQYRYVGIDSTSGQKLWELSVGRFIQFLRTPQLIKGILYFGDRGLGMYPWFENERQAHRLYAIDDDSLLSSKAMAVDFKTGEILWSIDLVGEGKPLIEKLIVQDDMVFIKSLNGWLYALGKEEKR